MNEAKADAGEVQRGVVVKVLGGEVIDRPASIGGGEKKPGQIFQEAGALLPDYDPMKLAYWVEHSTALRPCIDAYATAIDGHGHHLEPVLDFDAEDIRDRVIDILFQRAVMGGNMDPADPADAEVDAEIDRLKRRSRVERALATHFLDACCYEPGWTLTRLRREARVQLETTGYTAWEVMRDGKGRPSRFKLVPSYLVRMLPLEDDWTPVTEWARVTDVDLEAVEIPRQMRGYVQLDEAGGALTFFKSYRDPRVMSAIDGRVVATEAQLPEGHHPATELLWFDIPWMTSPYGRPRWTGAFPEVMGSRAASEVNYLLFDNKSVPPLAVLVSGGKLAAGATGKIETYIKDHIKGRENFHSILVIEAESDGKGGTAARVEVKPLRDAIPGDGLYQQYDERNLDKTGSQFRLPRLLRGDTRDFNRATAQAAMALTEDAVFGPERLNFDEAFGRLVLWDLGIRMWRFRSRTPVTRDPERTAKMMALLGQAGALFPADMRELLRDVFNRDFPAATGDWTRRPVAFTLAGIQTGRDAGDVKQQARTLMTLQEALTSERDALAQRREHLARVASGEGDAAVLRVPMAEWDTWFQPDE